MPLKGVPLARRRFDARAAPSGEDVDDFLVEMPLRRGLAARRDLDDLHVDEIASPGEVRERAVCFEARPGRDVKIEQVQTESLVDRDPFLRDPVLIWIDEEARLVHRATFSRAGSGARRWPHFFLVSRLVCASGPIAIGNLSRHSQGRVASMIIRELWPLTSGAIAGSSGPDQARLMMSSERSGSERVTTAHITSLRSVTSMSSSTTMTIRPRYAPTRHIAATCPACRECPAYRCSIETAFKRRQPPTPKQCASTTPGTPAVLSSRM